MQVLKLFPAVIAVAFSASLTVHADDSPAQAAARAALLDKMSEMNAQQNSSAPITVDANGVVPPAPVEATPAPAQAPASAEPVPVATESAPAPVEAAPTTVSAAEPAVNSNSDTPAQAAARAALMEQLNAPVSEQPAAAAAVVVPETSAVKAAPEPAPVKASAASGQSKPAGYAGKSLGFQPIATPELPISVTKEARLQALLQQYKADQITPEQYHAQRAAILAEP